MRSLGVLECRDCGERHAIHVNRAGQLVALEGCAAARDGGLADLARGQLVQHLREAAAELAALQRLAERPDVAPARVAARLDEVHRRLVRAENALPRRRPAPAPVPEAAPLVARWLGWA